MKKVLSLVLVLTLVLGSFSFAFAAVDFDDIEGKDCEDAVKTLASLGVVNGRPGGVFEPEDTITKAELAKILVYTLGCEDLVTEGARSNFSDCVGHWAESIIAFATGQQIVIGDGTGRFMPDKLLSYDEAITMVVRALGYTDECLKGTWPTMYKWKAKELGITDDVKISSSQADRGGVAMLVSNALDCYTVTINNDGDISKQEIGEDDEGDPIYRKLIDRVGDQVNIDVTPDTIDEDDKAYEETLIDIEKYMYETIVAYKNNDDEIVYVSGTKTKNIEGTFKGIEDGKVKVKVGEKTKKIDLDNVTSASIYFNGAYDEDVTLGAIATNSDIKLVFPSYKGNPDIDEECKGIVVNQSGEIVFVENEFDPDYPEELEGIALPIYEDDNGDNQVDLDRLTITGDATSLEDIQENDVINVYSSNIEDITEEPDYLKLVVTRESVEGKVTRVKKDDEGQVTEAKVDGDYYDVHEDACALGDEGTFFLDKDDNIVAWTGDSISLTDYALLIGTADGIEGERWGDPKNPQVKLFTDEGKTVVYDVKMKKNDGEYNNVGFLTIDKDSYEIGVDSDYDVPTGVELTLADKMEPVIVRYKINNDDELVDIEIPTNVSKITGTAANIDDEMIDETQDFVGGTTIFNVEGDGPDSYDYYVVDYDEVVEGAHAKPIYVVEKENSMGILDAVLLFDGARVNDPDNFAGIIEVEDGFDEETGDPVKILTVLLDGKKQTLYTDDDSIDNAVATTDKLVKLDINSDNIVTDIVDVDSAHDEYREGTISRFDKPNNKVSINGSTIKLSKDFAVYVYDKSDEELKKGNYSNVKTSAIKAIAYNSDEDNPGFEVILVIRR